MKEYHKIQTVFKRDPETNYKTLLMGEYSLPEFEFLKENIWEWTEKVDGTNIRVMFNGENITFGGKTDRTQIPAHLVNKLNEMFLPRLELFKEQFSTEDEKTEICFYGEGYGPKIQKGGKYRNDVSFVLFDIKIGHWWLKQQDIENIAEIFGIELVPIIYSGTLIQMVDFVKEGFKSTWGDFIAEGVVARPRIDLFSRNGGRIITKLKYNDFN